MLQDVERERPALNAIAQKPVGKQQDGGPLRSIPAGASGACQKHQNSDGGGDGDDPSSSDDRVGGLDRDRKLQNKQPEQHNVRSTNDRRRKCEDLVPNAYDGKYHLKAFLAQFENIAKYNGCNEEEKALAYKNLP
jgi:hypothetical protein